MYRTSSIFRENGDILQSDWDSFIQHMHLLKKVGYGKFDVSNELVGITPFYGESLVFKKDEAIAFCKTDLRDQFFLKTIAASFMLFDYLCRKGSHWEVVYSGNWEDGQSGVDSLKLIGVFDPHYDYIIPYSEKVNVDVRNLKKGAMESARQYVSCTDMLGKNSVEGLRDIVFDSVLQNRPNSLKEQHVINLIAERDILNKMVLVNVVIDGDAHWFIDDVDAVSFLASNFVNPPCRKNMGSMVVPEFEGVLEKRNIEITRHRYAVLKEKAQEEADTQFPLPFIY